MFEEVQRKARERAERAAGQPTKDNREKAAGQPKPNAPLTFGEQLAMRVAKLGESSSNSRSGYDSLLQKLVERFFVIANEQFEAQSKNTQSFAKEIPGNLSKSEALPWLQTPFMCALRLPIGVTNRALLTKNDPLFEPLGTKIVPADGSINQEVSEYFSRFPNTDDFGNTTLSESFTLAAQDQSDIDTNGEYSILPYILTIQIAAERIREQLDTERTDELKRYLGLQSRDEVEDALKGKRTDPKIKEQIDKNFTKIPEPPEESKREAYAVAASAIMKDRYAPRADVYEGLFAKHWTTFFKPSFLEAREMRNAFATYDVLNAHLATNKNISALLKEAYEAKSITKDNKGLLAYTCDKIKEAQRDIRIKYNNSTTKDTIKLAVEKDLKKVDLFNTLAHSLNMDILNELFASYQSKCTAADSSDDLKFLDEVVTRLIEEDADLNKKRDPDKKEIKRLMINSFVQQTQPHPKVLKASRDALMARFIAILLDASPVPNTAEGIKKLLEEQVTVDDIECVPNELSYQDELRELRNRVLTQRNREYLKDTHYKKAYLTSKTAKEKIDELKKQAVQEHGETPNAYIEARNKFADWIKQQMLEDFAPIPEEDMASEFKFIDDVRNNKAVTTEDNNVFTPSSASNFTVASTREPITNTDVNALRAEIYKLTMLNGPSPGTENLLSESERTSNAEAIARLEAQLKQARDELAHEKTLAETRVRIIQKQKQELASGNPGGANVAEVEELKAQILQLKQQHGDKGSQSKEDVKAMIASAIHQKQQELEQQKEKAAKFEAEKESLNVRVAELEADIKTSVEKFERITSTSATEIKQKIQDTVASSEARVAMLNEQLLQKTAEVEALRLKMDRLHANLLEIASNATGDSQSLILIASLRTQLDDVKVLAKQAQATQQQKQEEVSSLMYTIVQKEAELVESKTAATALQARVTALETSHSSFATGATPEEITHLKEAIKALRKTAATDQTLVAQLKTELAQHAKQQVGNNWQTVENAIEKCFQASISSAEMKDCIRGIQATNRVDRHSLSSIEKLRDQLNNPALTPVELAKVQVQINDDLWSLVAKLKGESIPILSNRLDQVRDAINANIQSNGYDTIRAVVTNEFVNSLLQDVHNCGTKRSKVCRNKRQQLEDLFTNTIADMAVTVHRKSNEAVWVTRNAKKGERIIKRSKGKIMVRKPPTRITIMGREFDFKKYEFIGLVK